MKDGRLIATLLVIIALLLITLGIKIGNSASKNQTQVVSKYQEDSNLSNTNKDEENNIKNDSIKSTSNIVEENNNDININKWYYQEEKIQNDEKKLAQPSQIQLFFAYLIIQIRMHAVPIIILIAMLIGFIKLYLELGGTISTIVGLIVSVILIIVLTTVSTVQRMQMPIFSSKTNPILGISIIISFIAMWRYAFIIMLQFLAGIELDFKYFILLIVVPIILTFIFRDISLQMYSILKNISIVCEGVFYVLINIKLADIFDKNIGYKLGLIFLPMIFWPLLGFTAKE